MIESCHHSNFIVTGVKTTSGVIHDEKSWHRDSSRVSVTGHDNLPNKYQILRISTHLLNTSIRLNSIYKRYLRPTRPKLTPYKTSLQLTEHILHNGLLTLNTSWVDKDLKCLSIVVRKRLYRHSFNCHVFESIWTVSTWSRFINGLHRALWTYEAITTKKLELRHDLFNLKMYKERVRQVYFKVYINAAYIAI